MIVDASVVVDAVADPGSRGTAARRALADIPTQERLSAPGHLAIEILSALRAAARRPAHPLHEHDVVPALRDAAALEVSIEGTSWDEVIRAWSLSGALRHADAVNVAAAESRRTGLLTSDGRIAASGAPMRCQIVTVRPSPPEER